MVVRGAGHSFSAGLDRSMLDAGRRADGVETVAGLLAPSDEEMSATIDAYQQGFTFLRDPRFVSVAAVQGYAVGAGFQLALACDLRVVADDAQFCMKESALGLVPDLTGTKPLVESVGYARALEICVTARMVGADGGRGHRAGADRRTRRRARRNRRGPRAAPSPRRCPARSPRPRRCSREQRTETSRSSGAWSVRPRSAASGRWPVLMTGQ